MLQQSLIVGKLPANDDRTGILLDEFLAWQMGFQNDTDLPKLIGQPIAVEYRVTKKQIENIYNLLTARWGQLRLEELHQQTQFLQALTQLMGDLDLTSLTDEQKSLLRELMGGGLQASEEAPDLLVTRQFIVRGIVHSGDEDPVAMLFRQWFHYTRGGLSVHPEVAAEIYHSQTESPKFLNASVFVESSAHLRKVSDTLRSKNYAPQSSLAILEQIDIQIDRSAWIIYGIAIAVLFTASVGISNTLIISIAERTPEFGIMKSIGARDSHILKLMIAEGAILGLMGAVIAVVLSFLIGACGQTLLKMYVESQTRTQIAGSLFQFQILPAVLILLLSVALCVTASLLPAWRAARLDPVVAMRRT